MSLYFQCNSLEHGWLWIQFILVTRRYNYETRKATIGLEHKIYITPRKETVEQAYV